MSETSTGRERELSTGLARVTARIADACEAAGRSPEEVTLVVVTKYFPASDVDILARLGVRDVGENRDQEAREKVDGLAASPPPSIHFVGQLQTNKANSVARYADVVHSVDRERLVRALDRGAENADRRLRVLVQVDLDERRGRGGVDPADAAALADAVAGSERLDLRGVMGVAPLEGAPGPAFERLREVRDEIVAGHPAATWLSAGMSGDLEEAVAHGATHLRVGSAILGPRPQHD